MKGIDDDGGGVGVRSGRGGGLSTPRESREMGLQLGMRQLGVNTRLLKAFFLERTARGAAECRIARPPNAYERRAGVMTRVLRTL